MSPRLERTALRLGQAPRQGEVPRQVARPGGLAAGGLSRPCLGDGIGERIFSKADEGALSFSDPQASRSRPDHRSSTTRSPRPEPQTPRRLRAPRTPPQIGIPLHRRIRRLGGGAERGASGRETPPETQVQRSRPPLEGPSARAERRGSEPMAATSRPIRRSGPYNAPVKTRVAPPDRRNGARADRSHHARPFTNPPPNLPATLPATPDPPSRREYGARWVEFNARHDFRFRFVYTPLHASWVNQIEQWFSILTRRVLRHASFRSLAELTGRVLAFITPRAA
jgi:hypothetical protein